MRRMPVARRGPDRDPSASRLVWDPKAKRLVDPDRAEPTATTEAKPQPQQADDPRSALDRGTGGPHIAGG